MIAWRGRLWVVAVSVFAIAGTGRPCAGQDPRVPPADTVISRVLDAYGGVAAIRAIESHRQDGLLVAMRGATHGRLSRVSAGPGVLCVRVEYPDHSETRILESGSALRGPDAASLVEVSGPLRGAMVLQAARSWLPRLLDDRRADVDVTGSHGGRTILEIRIAESLRLRVFVEDATGLIVRSESVLESVPGVFGFATDYSDFRRVEGVIFAFREETFAAGTHTGSTVLETVEVNPTGTQDPLRCPKGF